MEHLYENLALFMNFIFGGSGAVFWLLNYKERNTKNKSDEANATLDMQKSYSQFVQDTNLIIENFKKELLEVKTKLNHYEKQCKLCNNNKLT